MKGLLIALLVTATALLVLHQAASPNYAEFQQWKLAFEPSFKSEAEEFYRRTIFYHNLAAIQAHNSDPTHTYKMGINQFTAYTQQEFVQRYLSHIQRSSGIQQMKEGGVSAVIVDWVEQGAVSAVKNQGTCGGAALYSTLGGVQGLSKVATGTLQTFSTQQLIDCVFGCTGSQPLTGYNYYKTHSVCTDKEYPTTGKAGTCQSKSCAFKISGYTLVNGCTDLASAIMKQPVSVTVDASKWSVYSSGIFSNCGTSLNHMVLLVGMADEYWKCKNSWGTAWGEKGFIRLARGDTCGICQYAVYPQH